MLSIKIHSPRWLSTAVLKFQTFLGHLVVLWKAWDLRSLILVSLGLQVFLILFAPFRKKSGNFVLISSIWLAYLAADYVAIQAVSMVPNYSMTHAASVPHPDLLAFWAPFLLVHLGGPDPITALALEDNELWLRTVLHFVASMYATGRVFFQSLPTNSGLFFPTMLMLFAGFFKYLERVLSMYYAHSVQFKASSNQNTREHMDFEKRVEEARTRSLNDDGYVCLQDDFGSEECPNNLIIKMCKLSTWFFSTWKMVYVDNKPGLFIRNFGNYLWQHPLMTAEKGFTVLEMELNFAHDVLYTKMIVIHKKFGIFMRYASFLFQVVSLVVWILFIDKQSFHRLDVGITYTLLVGAVTIDFVAFLMVALSYWQMGCVGVHTKRASLYSALYPNLKRAWGAYWGPEESPLWQRIMRLFFRRWSESVYQFNILHYSLHTRPFIKLLPQLLKDQLGSLIYVSKKWFADELRDFIYDEIRYKSKFVDDLPKMEKMCDSKGEWILKSLDSLSLGLESDGFYECFRVHTYVECLMIWHIATELLFQTTIAKTRNSSTTDKDYRKFCKTLSDYMMYIFCWQPVMVSSATGYVTDLEFQSVASKLRKFAANARGNLTPKEGLMNNCQRLMNWDLTKKIHYSSFQDASDSMHADTLVVEAVCLARMLKKLEGRLKEERHMLDERPNPIEMWEVMAKVWVELMCYTATNCKGSIHTAKLKQGGELLTLVWLLMLHLGISKLYMTNH